MGQGPSKGILNQFKRQSTWLKEHWLWLLRTKVLPGMDEVGRRPKALDMGCGPGYVMDILASELDIVGLDMDPDMVSICKARDLDVIEGRGEDLPFPDREFDIVLCSFVMMWVKDLARVMSEMTRVSDRWVLCLAEPDHGGRIDHPEELAGLNDMISEGIRARGGDPFMGRKLRALMTGQGLKVEMGTHPGVWDTDRLEQEMEGEWSFIEDFTKGRVPDERLKQLRSAWDKALEKGTLFQYNPIFYALGQK